LVKAMRHSAWPDEQHFRNGCGARRVHREGPTVGHVRWRARDDRPCPEVVPREVAFVRCGFPRLPSPGDVLIAAHQNAAIGEQDRGGMVPPRVLHYRAGHPSRGEVPGIQNLRRSPGFGHDDSPDFTGTFQLFYKGDRFLYSVDFIGAKGTIYDRAETFDGDCYKSYDRRGETLTVSSKRFLNDIVMCQGHALFMPFLFLQSAFSKDAFAQLSYAQLTSKEDWENALVSIPPTSVVQEVTLENQSYLKVTGIGKNIDPASDGECLFDVYFAKGSNWYPTKWERRLLSGVVVASYSVDEIGLVQLESGESIPYPKRAIQKHYTDGKLRDTERIEVKQISFDSVSDEDLAIDATPAKYIRDLDNGGKLKAVK